MALQATGSWDPYENIYSITMCWNDGPYLTFEDLERDDLKHLQSLVEILLMEEKILLMEKND